MVMGWYVNYLHIQKFLLDKVRGKQSTCTGLDISSKTVDLGLGKVKIYCPTCNSEIFETQELQVAHLIPCFGLDDFLGKGDLTKAQKEIWKNVHNSVESLGNTIFFFFVENCLQLL